MSDYESEYEEYGSEDGDGSGDGEDKESLYEEEVEFRAELKARERVGGDIFFETQGLTRQQRKMEKIGQEPVDKFRVYVNAIAWNIRSYDEELIGKDDIGNMLDLVSKWKNIAYRNPSAYILGYIASSGGKKITSGSFGKAVNRILPIMKDQSVSSAAVLRYARHWMVLRSIFDFETE